MARPPLTARSLAKWLLMVPAMAAGVAGDSGGTAAHDTGQAAPYALRRESVLADARIDESSGLGASRRYPGYLWTHNDSGDSARLFLITATGHTAAEVQLDGAQALDWEDMAVAGGGESAHVYIGDIGDNLKARPFVTIYRFAEALLPVAPAALRQWGEAGRTNERAPQLTVPAEQMTLVYPDGPRDAETLLATPDGRLLIVSKDLALSHVYISPHPFRAGERQVLRKLGELRLGSVSIWSKLVTGGDLSPDGAKLVLRSYTTAHEWRLEAPWRVDGGWTRQTPVEWGLPQSRQGEAICYGLDSKSLVTSSEKLPAPLFEMASQPMEPSAAPGGGP